MAHFGVKVTNAVHHHWFWGGGYIEKTDLRLIMFFSHNFAGRGVEPIKQPHNFGPGPLARARYFLVVIQPPVIDRHSPSQMRQNVQFVLSRERQCTFPHARQLMSQNHRVEAAAKVTRHADVQRRRLVQLLHTLNNDRKRMKVALILHIYPTHRPIERSGPH